MRVVLVFLVIGMAVWMALHQCTNVAQKTLVIKPAASFPAEKKQLLGQMVARILPHCPGFQALGNVLEFTDITTSGTTSTINFIAPDTDAIPAAWGARGQSCSLRIKQDVLDLGDKAACQALCIGQPGAEGQQIRKDMVISQGK